MATLILSQSEVRRLLSMQQCMILMERALLTLARGDAVNPLRWGMRLPDNPGLLGMMPGYLADPPALGIKVVTVFPQNHGTEFDSHQGVVVLFDPKTGVPRAILDGSEVTAIRTAAVSGVATRVLARETACDLAIIGSGVQARTHLEAMLLVRHLRRVRAFSPNAEHLESFVTRESRRHDIEIEPMTSVAATVEGADLICTTTASKTPVLPGRLISDGAHINAVGASIKTARELDTDAVLKAQLFVDRMESAVNEAGEIVIPRDEGRLDESHIVGEIGDILTGKLAGRTSNAEITLFKSLGLAVEDVAVAHYLFEQAHEQNVGTEVDLGGRKQ